MTTPRQRARLAANEERQRITELEQRLAAIPAGTPSISIDGTTTQFSRSDILDEIDRRRKRLARLTGAKELAATIRLDNSF